MPDHSSQEPVFAETRRYFENFEVQPHPYMGFELTPNFRSVDGQASHNRHGFRGPDFEQIKPSGVRRIICMGESTTYCTGVKDDETYPMRLQHHLAAARPGEHWEVINAGVPAYTSAENVIQFIFRIQPLQPDFVIYLFAHNDLTARRSPRLSRDYREFAKVWGDKIWGEYLPPSTSSRWPAWLTEPFRNKRRPLQNAGIARMVRHYNRLDYANITTNPTSHFRDNLRTLAGLTKAWDIPLLFLLPNYPPITPKTKANKRLRAEAIEEHRTIAESVARESNSLLLDLSRHIGPEAGAPLREELYFDPSHLTPKGCDWVAGLVAGMIPTAPP